MDFSSSHGLVLVARPMAGVLVLPRPVHARNLEGLEPERGRKGVPLANDEGLAHFDILKDLHVTAGGKL